MDAAAYAPVKMSCANAVNLDDREFDDEFIQLEDDDEDVEVLIDSNKANIDLIELGSSEDEIEADLPSTSTGSIQFEFFRKNLF